MKLEAANWLLSLLAVASIADFATAERKPKKSGTRNRSREQNEEAEVTSTTTEDPLAKILPLVTFICKGRHEGYYADVEFNCEVFHYCNGQGMLYTFMCPPTSRFNQKNLICDYDRYGKKSCAKSSEYFHINESIRPKDNNTVTTASSIDTSTIKPLIYDSYDSRITKEKEVPTTKTSTSWPHGNHRRQKITELPTNAFVTQNPRENDAPQDAPYDYDDYEYPMPRHYYDDYETSTETYEQDQAKANEGTDKKKKRKKKKSTTIIGTSVQKSTTVVGRSVELHQDDHVTTEQIDFQRETTTTEIPISHHVDGDFMRELTTTTTDKSNLYQDHRDNDTPRRKQVLDYNDPESDAEASEDAAISQNPDEYGSRKERRSDDAKDEVTPPTRRRGHRRDRKYEKDTVADSSTNTPVRSLFNRQRPKNKFNLSAARSTTTTESSISQSDLDSSSPSHTSSPHNQENHSVEYTTVEISTEKPKLPRTRTNTRERTPYASRLTERPRRKKIRTTTPGPVDYDYKAEIVEIQPTEPPKTRMRTRGRKKLKSRTETTVQRPNVYYDDQYESTTQSHFTTTTQVPDISSQQDDPRVSNYDRGTTPAPNYSYYSVQSTSERESVGHNPHEEATPSRIIKRVKHRKRPQSTTIPPPPSSTFVGPLVDPFDIPPPTHLFEESTNPPFRPTSSPRHRATIRLNANRYENYSPAPTTPTPRKKKVIKGHKVTIALSKHLVKPKKKAKGPSKDFFFKSQPDPLPDYSAVLEEERSKPIDYQRRPQPPPRENQYSQGYRESRYMEPKAPQQYETQPHVPAPSPQPVVRPVPTGNYQNSNGFSPLMPTQDNNSFRPMNGIGDISPWYPVPQPQRSNQPGSNQLEGIYQNAPVFTISENADGLYAVPSPNPVPPPQTQQQRPPEHYDYQSQQQQFQPSQYQVERPPPNQYEQSGSNEQYQPSKPENYQNRPEPYQDSRQPQEQYYDVRQPQEQYQDFRQPQEQYQEVRQPQEQYQGVRQPQEQYQEVRQPQEQYQEVRQPQEQYQEVRQPQEQYQEVRQPQEQYQEVRQPQEQFVEIRHQNEYRPQYQTLQQEHRFNESPRDYDDARKQRLRKYQESRQEGHRSYENSREPTPAQSEEQFGIYSPGYQYENRPETYPSQNAQALRNEYQPYAEGSELDPVTDQYVEVSSYQPEQQQPEESRHESNPAESNQQQIEATTLYESQRMAPQTHEVSYDNTPSNQGVTEPTRERYVFITEVSTQKGQAPARQPELITIESNVPEQPNQVEYDSDKQSYQQQTHINQNEEEIAYPLNNQERNQAEPANNYPVYADSQTVLTNVEHHQNHVQHGVLNSHHDAPTIQTIYHSNSYPIVTHVNYKDSVHENQMSDSITSSHYANKEQPFSNVAKIPSHESETDGTHFDDREQTPFMGSYTYKGPKIMNENMDGKEMFYKEFGGGENLDSMTFESNNFHSRDGTLEKAESINRASMKREAIYEPEHHKNFFNADIDLDESASANKKSGNASESIRRRRQTIFADHLHQAVSPYMGSRPPRINVPFGHITRQGQIFMQDNGGRYINNANSVINARPIPQDQRYGQLPRHPVLHGAQPVRLYHPGAPPPQYHPNFAQQQRPHIQPHNPLMLNSPAPPGHILMGFPLTVPTIRVPHAQHVGQQIMAPPHAQFQGYSRPLQPQGPLPNEEDNRQYQQERPQSQFSEPYSLSQSDEGRPSPHQHENSGVIHGVHGQPTVPYYGYGYNPYRRPNNNKPDNQGDSNGPGEDNSREREPPSQDYDTRDRPQEYEDDRRGQSGSYPSDQSDSYNNRNPSSDEQDSYQRNPSSDQSDSYNRNPSANQEDSYHRNPSSDQSDSYNRNPSSDQSNSYNRNPSDQSESYQNSRNPSAQSESYNRNLSDQSESYNRNPSDQSESYNRNPSDQSESYNRNPSDQSGSYDRDRSQSENSRPDYESERGERPPNQYDSQEDKEKPSEEEESGNSTETSTLPYPDNVHAHYLKQYNDSDPISNPFDADFFKPPPYFNHIPPYADLSIPKKENETHQMEERKPNKHGPPFRPPTPPVLPSYYGPYDPSNTNTNINNETEKRPPFDYNGYTIPPVPAFTVTFPPPSKYTTTTEDSKSGSESNKDSISVTEATGEMTNLPSPVMAKSEIQETSEVPPTTQHTQPASSTVGFGGRIRPVASKIFPRPTYKPSRGGTVFTTEPSTTKTPFTYRKATTTTTTIAPYANEDQTQQSNKKVFHATGGAMSDKKTRPKFPGILRGRTTTTTTETDLAGGESEVDYVSQEPSAEFLVNNQPDKEINFKHGQTVSYLLKTKAETNELTTLSPNRTTNYKLGFESTTATPSPSSNVPAPSTKWSEPVVSDVHQYLDQEAGSSPWAIYKEIGSPDSKRFSPSWITDNPYKVERHKDDKIIGASDVVTVPTLPVHNIFNVSVKWSPKIDESQAESSTKNIYKIPFSFDTTTPIPTIETARVTSSHITRYTSKTPGTPWRIKIEDLMPKTKAENVADEIKVRPVYNAKAKYPTTTQEPVTFSPIAVFNFERTITTETPVTTTTSMTTISTGNDVTTPFGIPEITTRGSVEPKTTTSSTIKETDEPKTTTTTEDPFPGLDLSQLSLVDNIVADSVVRVVAAHAPPGYLEKFDSKRLRIKAM